MRRLQIPPRSRSRKHKLRAGAVADVHRRLAQPSSLHRRCRLSQSRRPSKQANLHPRFMRAYFEQRRRRGDEHPAFGILHGRRQRKSSNRRGHVRLSESWRQRAFDSARKNGGATAHADGVRAPARVPRRLDEGSLPREASRGMPRWPALQGDRQQLRRACREMDRRANRHGGR